MASPKEYPNFVKAIAALGEARLRKVGATKKIAVPLSPGDPAALATALVRGIKNPSDLMDHSNKEYDVMAAALGMPSKAEWKPSISAAEIAKLPDYRRPSHAQDVINAVYSRVRPPRALPRAATAAVLHTKDWPELASRAKWKKAKPDVVAKALAAALGFKPATATADGFARVTDSKSKITYVAVVGDTFMMGISADEKRALNKRAKALDVDAQEHAKLIAKQASPAHEVTIAPFLISEALLGEPVDAEDAAALVAKSGRRLPSDAEWEYLARGNESAWLALSDEGAPFGLKNLALGEWVDDGWHDTYKGAPADGRAWEPRTRPEIARSGAGVLFPWQNPGEELLLHVTARERSFDLHGVRFALDLPAR